MNRKVLATLLILIGVVCLGEDIIINSAKDRIIVDSTADDIGNSVFAENWEFNAVGDTGGDAELRTVLEFNLSSYKELIAGASSINFSIQTKETLGTPFKWVLFHMTEGNNGTVVENDYQAAGAQVGAEQLGAQQAETRIQFDVTDEVKADALAGEWSSFRLQVLKPEFVSDNDAVADQIRFYTNEDEVEKRPYLKVIASPVSLSLTALY